MGGEGERGRRRGAATQSSTAQRTAESGPEAEEQWGSGSRMESTRGCRELSHTTATIARAQQHSPDWSGAKSGVSAPQRSFVRRREFKNSATGALYSHAERRLPFARYSRRYVIASDRVVLQARGVLMRLCRYDDCSAPNASSHWNILFCSRTSALSHRMTSIFGVQRNLRRNRNRGRSIHCASPRASLVLPSSCIPRRCLIRQ